MLTRAKTRKFTIFTQNRQFPIMCNLVISRFDSQNPQIPRDPLSTSKSLKNDDFMSDLDPENRTQKVEKCQNSQNFRNSLITFSKLPKRPCRIAALIVKFTK